MVLLNKIFNPFLKSFDIDVNITLIELTIENYNIHFVNN